MDSNKKTVLFVCTHNAARSQMAEALLNAFHGDHYEACSAGTEPTEVHPLAHRVMSEIEIDLSHHRSKSIDDFEGRDFDWVITLCDHAFETCPVFPGGYKRVHKGFTDPAAAQGSEGERLEAFRAVRDDIKEWIAATIIATDE